MDRTSTVHILQVDDDPQFGDITKRFLEREDERFSVVAETTAEDGIARLQEGAFDCIVSDYELPDMDGVEFLETVRRDNPTLPFILFTGKGTEDVASRAITAGVTDYLQKQSGIDQYTILANRIGNAVDRVQALRQSELSHRTMETATEGLSLVKGDGTFLYVNCAFADLFGYDQDELIDTHWSVLYHKKEAERLETHILPAVHETGYWAGETVRLTKGGQRLVTDHRLSHTEEDVIVCTARDLTDDRASPIEQSTSLDLLLDAINDRVFYTLDHEEYITRWTDGATALLGYPREEILGTHLGHLFTDNNPHQASPTELLEKAHKTGTATETRMHRHDDGSRLSVEVTISASKDETGTLRGFGALMREAAG